MWLHTNPDRTAAQAASARSVLPYALIVALLLVVPALTGCGDDDSTSPEDSTACNDTPGTICTWAGTGQAGFDGDGHTLLESHFYWPIDVTFAPGGDTYIVDWNNHRVRLLENSGTLRTVIGTNDVGDGPEDRGDLTPPGSPGTTVTLNHPTEFLPLPSGNLILLAWHNHKLREYDPSTGLVLVTCGSGAGYVGDGGQAKTAKLNQPDQGAVAPDGTVFVLDQRNQCIRRIGSDGIISTVAGTPQQAGFAGDGGPPLEAKINMPTGTNPPPGGGIVLDAQGRLYISDVLNHRIRRVDFAANLMETVAGNGTAGFSGDDGPAIDASLNNPRDLEIGPDGRLYVADEKNNRIRAIDLTTGTITTVAGNGTAAYTGDGSDAKAASLRRPGGIAFDDEGHLYIADTYNHVIRRVNL